MCKIVSVGTLDRVARDFVDSFGGYGIVMDEEVASEAVREEEAAVESIPMITRIPRPVKEKGMWQ